MKNGFFMAYALGAYAVAMANIAYIIAFLGNVIVPKTINGGSWGVFPWPAVPSADPTIQLVFAVGLNTLLVLVFGLHHSITARSSFKAWWTRIVPAPIERATYLYMTAAMSALLVWLWQPIPITIWKVESTLPVILITSGYLAVWCLMFAATFHFGHFGFFGLAQVWERVRNRVEGEASFTNRYLYAIVRHPISLGWMLTPWIVPHFTVGQLVFASSAAAYVLVATRFEEADLIAQLGERYRRYRSEVPAFLPRLR